jgi:cell shape-determining protein MreC
MHKLTSGAEGSLSKKRGPVANPNRAELQRLEAENRRLKRQLERAELIIDAQKKLARLLEEEQS